MSSWISQRIRRYEEEDPDGLHGPQDGGASLGPADEARQEPAPSPESEDLPPLPPVTDDGRWWWDEEAHSWQPMPEAVVEADRAQDPDGHPGVLTADALQIHAGDEVEAGAPEDEEDGSRDKELAVEAGPGPSPTSADAAPDAPEAGAPTEIDIRLPMRPQLARRYDVHLPDGDGAHTGSPIVPVRAFEPEPEPEPEAELDPEPEPEAVPGEPDLFPDLGPAPLVPHQGLRAMLYWPIRRLTSDRVVLQPSRSERQRRSWIEQARTPVRGVTQLVGIFAQKGGVGKTTTTIGLASTLGTIRGLVFAVDCNPDPGTLSMLFPNGRRLTIRDLLNDLDEISTWPYLQAYLQQVPDTQAWVLNSPLEPYQRRFSEDDYELVFNKLGRFGDVVCLDTGTSLSESASGRESLSVCTQALVVTTPDRKEVELASRTLDGLASLRGEAWVRQRALVVINRVSPRNELPVQKVAERVMGRVRACCPIPEDAHLSTARLNPYALRPQTRDAYLQLAATLAVGFALPPERPPSGAGSVVRG